MSDGRVFYGDVAPDSDVIAQPMPAGMQFLFQLRSDQSPELLRLKLDLPAGASLRLAPDGGAPGDSMAKVAAQVVRGDEALATVMPPAAWDAEGEPVPTRYEIDGDTLVVRVEHRGGDYQYPLLVDPYILEGWVHPQFGTEAGANAAGWSFFSSPNDRRYWGAGLWSNPGGNGLVVYTNNPNTYWYGDGWYGEWFWQAPGQSEIFRADYYSSHRPATRDWTLLYSKAVGGLYNPSGGQWEWGSPWENGTSHDGVWATNCAGENCNWDAGTVGNLFAYGDVMVGSGTRGVQGFANVSAMYLYLNDRNNPYFSSIQHYGRPDPGTWVQRATPTASFTGTDPGLGVRLTALEVWGESRITWGRCGRSYQYPGQPTPCPTNLDGTYSYDTNDFPEGIQNYNALVRDALERDTRQSWTMKVDRSGPELSVGGTIPAADGGFAPGNATLTLNASDGAPAAPRSGISYVDVVVNGEIRRRFEPPCANQDNCALETQTWSLPDRAEGPYTVEVYAVDGAGNRSRSYTYTIRREERPPGLSLEGDLWAADGRIVSDAAYDLEITSLDGDEEDPESGMKSLEVLVDGTRRHFVDRTCSAQGNCELETSFTFRPAEFDPGLRTIEIVAIDQHDNEVREVMAVEVRHISDLPADERNVEAGASLRFTGGQADDRAGASVARIGDLNNDGLDDYIIGAPGADNNLRLDSGSAYVVYGSDGGGSVDLANLGPRGFRIDGAQPFDGAGAAVAPAGDVNGDGVPDLLVGAPQALAPPNLSLQGRVYVVFGHATPPGVPDQDLDLAQIAQQGRGFAVIGRQLTLAVPLQPSDRPFGSTLSGAPRDEATGEADVNGDDLDDLVIGAPMEAASGAVADNRGAAYVVYGKGTSQPVDTAQLGTAGYRITGASLGDRAGSAAAIVGDVNGDGSSDVALGAPGRNAASQEGALFLALAGSGEDVDLATAGGSPNAYLIAGSTGDELGRSIAAVGDMDNDSLADVLVGGRRPTVVFGREASDSYSTTDPLGSEQTYQLVPGTTERDPSAVVANAGDLNRDGTPDIAMSLPGADVAYTALSQVGQAAVTGRTVALPSRPGQQGTRLVAPGGTAAIDGLQDAGGEQGGLLVGAPAASGQRGAAFVYPAGATTGGRTDPQAEAAGSGCYRNLNVARPFVPRTFPVCRLSLRKNRDQTPVSPRRGYKARGYPLTTAQRRGPNARKDLKRRLNKNQSEGNRRRWRLVDSLNETVGWIEQLKGRTEFALYDDAKDLVDQTSPKSDLRVRLEGRPCMSSNTTADNKALVVLYGSSSAGVNGRDVAFRAIIDRAAFPAEAFRNNVDNDRYIDGAWLTCGKRAGIGRFTKNPPSEPLEFAAPTTWRYQGRGTAGRARCNPTDPQCGSRYDNYAFPNLAAINQNPDPPDRPGVMPRTVTISSSTSGVQRGAIVRGLVLEGTAVSRLDEVGYADDNTSCGTPRRVRWRLVDANATRTGGTQRLIGWSPEVLADTDPKAKAPRC